MSASDAQPADDSGARLTLRILPPAGAAATTIAVDADCTLRTLKERVAPLSRISSPADVRIVLGGRILRDDEATLASLGVADGATLHVVKLAANTAGEAAAASPGSARQATAGAGASNPFLPAELQSPLNGAFMDLLASNPGLMRAMIGADPRLAALRERHPEMAQMLDDPEFLRQMVQSMRNPALMNEMMRNHDRSLSNIEGLPGGMAALSSMYRSLELEDEALDPRREAGTTAESNRRFAERLGALGAGSTNAGGGTAAGPNQAALPNPWAPSPPAQQQTRPGKVPG
ncbi:hypothetical protein HK405_015615, partial [Cladochytrium tenue]